MRVTQFALCKHKQMSAVQCGTAQYGAITALRSTVQL